MFNLLFNKKKLLGGVSVVFDIGGTKIRAAKVVGDELENVFVVSTPHDAPKEGEELLVELIRKAADTDLITSLVGCFAGRLDSEGKIFGARNLWKWKGTPLDGFLENTFNAPAQIFNDCELVGLGEAHRGSGVGSQTMVYITVSTGVGGARIVNGTIDLKASDFSVSRMMVGDSDLESQISGTAVKNKFGIEAKNLSSSEEREILADILAQGLVKVVSEWKPDTIVLGGSMIVGKENTIPLERVEKTLKEIMQGSNSSIPQIKKATLGDLGGLYGGLEYLKQKTAE